MDGIQLGDLLLGAIAYDCKLQVGLVPSKGRSPKRAFVRALRDQLGVLSLAEPFRSGKFNIAPSPFPLAERATLGGLSLGMWKTRFHIWKSE